MKSASARGDPGVILEKMVLTKGTGEEIDCYPGPQESYGTNGTRKSFDRYPSVE